MLCSRNKPVLSLIVVGIIIPICAPSESTTYDVVIDPGHGGSDPGTLTHINGYYEKHINLQIADELETFLYDAPLP